MASDRLDVQYKTTHCPAEEGKRKTMKILLVGPKGPPVGGTTVLFEQLCGALDSQSDIHVSVINSAASGIGRSPLSVMRFLFRVLMQSRHHDVTVLHASSTSMIPIVGGVLRLSALIFGTRWGFRSFGGRFPVYWREQSAMARTILKLSLLKADQLFFETRESVEFVSQLTDSPVDWFPNSRVLEKTPELRSGPAQRFVFVSHVKPSKGVRILFEAVKGLSGIEVDVYGPLSEGLSASEFENSIVNYKGELASEDVPGVLAGSDVLLLPTFYSGEGYPGIILEAYAAGLPVITTNWRCIPEIADDSCAMLVEPKNAEQLRDAMAKISSDVALADKLRQGAARQAAEFSSSKWDRFFCEKVRRLVSS